MVICSWFLFQVVISNMRQEQLIVATVLSANGCLLKLFVDVTFEAFVGHGCPLALVMLFGKLAE